MFKKLLVLLGIVLMLTSCEAKPEEVTDAPITITYNEEKFTGTFSGTLLEESPIETGTYKDDSGWEFTGSFENGSFAQTGTISNLSLELNINETIITGIYEGSVKDLLPDGNGVFTSDSFTYEGSFVEGTPSGKGTVKEMPFVTSYQDFNFEGVYEGEVLDLLPNGNGTYNVESEDTYLYYNGSFSNGIFSGDGELDTNHYSIQFTEVLRVGTYKGSTKDGLASGQGYFSAISSDNLFYEYTGNFENGTFNGEGQRVIHHEDRDIIEGPIFVNGDWHLTSLSDFMQNIGNDDDFSFILSKEAKEFIDAYEVNFIEGPPDIFNDFINDDLTYRKYIRQPDKYLADMIVWGSYEVIQIWIFDGYDDLSEYDAMDILAMDPDGNIVLLVGLSPDGSMDDWDIYEGSQIAFAGLPVAYTSYKNASGGTSKCVVVTLAAVEWY